jgi:hypothetical protein
MPAPKLNNELERLKKVAEIAAIKLYTAPKVLADLVKEGERHQIKTAQERIAKFQKEGAQEVEKERIANSLKKAAQKANAKLQKKHEEIDALGLTLEQKSNAQNLSNGMKMAVHMYDAAVYYDSTILSPALGCIKSISSTLASNANKCKNYVVAHTDVVALCVLVGVATCAFVGVGVQNRAVIKSVGSKLIGEMLEKGSQFSSYASKVISEKAVAAYSVISR